MKKLYCLLVFANIAACVSAIAQVPRINTFFPIGARAGSTVEVEIRGASLDGANLLLIHGSKISGTVIPGIAKVDETNKPVWQSKCGGCHELRSPANRSLTPGQWAATVERMVKLRSAPLSADEVMKVSQYLSGAARAGKVSAQITVPADTQPGVFEIRVVTAKGVSSPSLFEVGNLPEVMGAGSTREQAQPVTLPCIANGCFAAGGEKHFFKFNAKKGEHNVFNVKAFRYNESNQFVFSPNLRLYNSSGKLLVENHGYYELDPLIDWECPEDGAYTVEIRDLLGRANPASVYRLTMGRLPYDSVISPPVGQVGTSVTAAVAGKAVDGLSSTFQVLVPTSPGVCKSASPFGPQLFYVSNYPVTREETKSVGGKPTTLPACFTGTIGKAGEVDNFSVQATGTYEFEGYAVRVNSPVALSVSLVKADGGAVASFGNDGRMTVKLEANQTYQLRVANGTGQGGANMVYAIEARPALPGIECMLRPENITLRPGTGSLAMVVVNRRDGVEGDLTVTAEDLPAGVTASTITIPPDRNIGWIQLTAAANASPVEKPIRILVSGKGPLGESKVTAVPQEEFRLNNNPMYRIWSDATLTVRGEADFTLEFTSPREPVMVHPRKAALVKVKIIRKPGFKGNVTVYLTGLPLGWVANPEASTGNEVTLTVRPDGNDTNPFLKRDPKWLPIQASLEGASDEFRFAFGYLTVRRVAVITDKDD